MATESCRRTCQRSILRSSDTIRPSRHRRGRNDRRVETRYCGLIQMKRYLSSNLPRQIIFGRETIAGPLAPVLRRLSLRAGLNLRSPDYPQNLAHREFLAGCEIRFRWLRDDWEANLRSFHPSSATTSSARSRIPCTEGVVGIKPRTTGLAFACS